MKGYEPNKMSDVVNNGSARVEEYLYLVRRTKLSTLTRRMCKEPILQHTSIFTTAGAGSTR